MKNKSSYKKTIVFSIIAVLIVSLTIFFALKYNNKGETFYQVEKSQLDIEMEKISNDLFGFVSYHKVSANILSDDERYSFNEQDIKSIKSIYKISKVKDSSNYVYFAYLEAKDKTNFIDKIKLTNNIYIKAKDDMVMFGNTSNEAFASFRQEGSQGEFEKYYLKILKDKEFTNQRIFYTGIFSELFNERDTSGEFVKKDINCDIYISYTNTFGKNETLLYAKDLESKNSAMQEVLECQVFMRDNSYIDKLVNEDILDIDIPNGTKDNNVIFLKYLNDIAQRKFNDDISDEMEKSKATYDNDVNNLGSEYEKETLVGYENIRLSKYTNKNDRSRFVLFFYSIEVVSDTQYQQKNLSLAKLKEIINFEKISDDEVDKLGDTFTLDSKTVSILNGDLEIKLELKKIESYKLSGGI